MGSTPTTGSGGRFYPFVITAGQPLPISIAGTCFLVLSSLLPILIAPDGKAQSLYWEGLGLIAQSEFKSLQVSIPSTIIFNGNAPKNFTIWLWIGYDRPLSAQQFRPYWQNVILAADNISGIDVAKFIPDLSGTPGSYFAYLCATAYQSANNIAVPVSPIRRHNLIIGGGSASVGSLINTNAGQPSGGKIAYIGVDENEPIEAVGDFRITTNLGGSNTPSYIDIYECVPNCPN